MTAIREAIHKLLSQDATIKNLAPGGVHYQMAQQGTNPPLAIFAPYTENERWNFTGKPTSEDQWLVRGVGEAEQAEKIDARCRELLLDNLTITGRTTLWLRRVSGVSYVEEAGGDMYFHHGSIYRLVTEAT